MLCPDFCESILRASSEQVGAHAGWVHVVVYKSFNDGWKLCGDEEVAGGLKSINDGSKGGTNL